MFHIHLVAATVAVGVPHIGEFESNHSYSHRFSPNSITHVIICCHHVKETDMPDAPQRTWKDTVSFCAVCFPHDMCVKLPKTSRLSSNECRLRGTARWIMKRKLLVVGAFSFLQRLHVRMDGRGGASSRVLLWIVMYELIARSGSGFNDVVVVSCASDPNQVLYAFLGSTYHGSLPSMSASRDARHVRTGPTGDLSRVSVLLNWGVVCLLDSQVEAQAFVFHNTGARWSRDGRSPLVPLYILRLQPI